VSHHQPISVIAEAPTGATALTALLRLSIESTPDCPPFGFVVGATVTNPQFIPTTKPLLVELLLEELSEELELLLELDEELLDDTDELLEDEELEDKDKLEELEDDDDSALLELEEELLNELLLEDKELELEDEEELGVGSSTPISHVKRTPPSISSVKIVDKSVPVPLKAELTPSIWKSSVPLPTLVK